MEYEGGRGKEEFKNDFRSWPSDLLKQQIGCILLRRLKGIGPGARGKFFLVALKVATPSVLHAMPSASDTGGITCDIWW